MLPNVKSIEDTKKQILYYTVINNFISYSPIFNESVGIIYIILASILNLLLFH